MTEYDAFQAGWIARVEYDDHDWGPSPPDNVRDAYLEWKNSCASGHRTFDIPTARHMQLPCQDCLKLIRRGKFSF